MATDETVYLSYDEAVWFHFQLMRKYKETRYGIGFRELLQSALARPRNAAIYENADVIRQAATLCLGLIKNHPFIGGNKRTASFLMRIFLRSNGYQKGWTVAEQIEMVLSVESNAWKVDEIEFWLREKTIKL